MGRGGRGHGGRSHGARSHGARSHGIGHRSHFGHHIGHHHRSHFSHGRAIHHQRVLVPPAPIPNPVFAIEMEGLEPSCGFPGCCTDNALHVKASDKALQVPPGLADVYTPREWAELHFKIDDIFKATGAPPCPGALFLICVFICIAGACQSNRRNALDVIIKAENARLARQGLAWQLVNQSDWWFPAVANVAMVLTWTPQRKEFEQAFPGSRLISLEYPPQRFCTYEQLQAQGLLTPIQIQMHQLQMAMLEQQHQQPLIPGQVAPQLVYQPMVGQAHPPAPFVPGMMAQQEGQLQQQQQPQQQYVPGQPLMVAPAPPPLYGQAMSPSGPSPPGGGAFCGACGTPRGPSDRFCAACGRPL